MILHPKYEKTLWLLSILTILISLFLNLGVQPLYLEEPRRAFISMEMYQNGNWYVPTLWGQLYYNKPPFFNWILMLSASLFGGFSEWAMRLPTVLSHLLMGASIYLFFRKYSTEIIARYTAFLWLVNGGLLFYFSTLAEIDIFFSLLIFLGIISIYHFAQQEKWWALFPTVYSLAGFAFLCKGIPAFIFAAWSLFIFFLWKRKFKKLFHPAHFAGITIFGLLVGGYFYIYSQHSDPRPFLTNLWSESSQRTAAENSSLKFIFHLLTFPFEVLTQLLPALFLFPFMIKRKIGQQLLKHELAVFCGLMLLGNLIPYWLSPGTRMRYIYMLLPFGIFLLVLVWQANKESSKQWQKKLKDILIGVPIFVFTLAAIGLYFVPDLDFLPYRLILSIALFIGFSLIAGLFYFNPSLRMLLLILSFGVARIAFDLTVLPQRAYQSGAQENKEMAKRFHDFTQDAPLLIVGDEKIFSYTSTYYLNRLRKEAIKSEINPAFQSSTFYIISQDQIPPKAQVLERYTYDQKPIALIQIAE